MPPFVHHLPHGIAFLGKDCASACSCPLLSWLWLAQRRRDRINERMRMLQELIPNSNKVLIHLSSKALCVTHFRRMASCVRVRVTMACQYCIGVAACSWGCCLLSCPLVWLLLRPCRPCRLTRLRCLTRPSSTSRCSNSSSRYASHRTCKWAGSAPLPPLTSPLPSQHALAFKPRLWLSCPLLPFLC